MKFQMRNGWRRDEKKVFKRGDFKVINADNWTFLQPVISDDHDFKLILPQELKIWDKCIAFYQEAGAGVEVWAAVFLNPFGHDLNLSRMRRTILDFCQKLDTKGR